MHANEVATDAALVARLLTTQFPHWSDLRVEPVASSGTDNAIFRLGPDLAVRLPRVPSAEAQVDLEHRWLPFLASFVPLAIPVPLGKGTPGEGYPFVWSVYEWVHGEEAVAVADAEQTGVELGEFVAVLRRTNPADAPRSRRGVPLKTLDDEVRAAISAVRGMIDTRAATAAWEAALAAPEWNGPPVWTHGDLLPTNLIANYGRLTAVIDFGVAGVGDPAVDTMAAWTYLGPDARESFQAAVDVDEATWARGKGWALVFGLIALPYYHQTNPVLADIARRAVEEVIASGF